MKTVKELLNFYLTSCGYMSENECQKFENILIAYEEEISEKDKEIKDLEKEWEKLVCEKYYLQQTQLYKEDFDEVYSFKVCEMFNGNYYMYCLIDISKYNKLPSKEEK